MKRDPVDLSRPVIAAYKHRPRGIEHDGVENTPQDRVEWDQKINEHGGFHPVYKTWKPLTGVATGEVWLYDALDHITAACEAGIVEKNTWASQLFETGEDLEWFLDGIRHFDSSWRIIDRWWSALAALAGVHDEEGFSACEEIAYALEQAIAEGAREAKRREDFAQFVAGQSPSVPVELDGGEYVVLSQHNSKVSRAHMNELCGHERHFTIGRFIHGFLYLEAKQVREREATRADIDKLMKAKAKGKARANK